MIEEEQYFKWELFKSVKKYRMDGSIIYGQRESANIQGKRDKFGYVIGKNTLNFLKGWRGYKGTKW